MQRRRIEAFEDEKFKCKGKQYPLYGQVRPFSWGDASGSGKAKQNGQVWIKPSLKDLTLPQMIAFIIDRNCISACAQSLRTKLWLLSSQWL
jgi:hypothetical protein